MYWNIIVGFIDATSVDGMIRLDHSRITPHHCSEGKAGFRKPMLFLGMNQWDMLVAMPYDGLDCGHAMWATVRDGQGSMLSV
jgi:hypothetical protein